MTTITLTKHLLTDEWRLQWRSGGNKVGSLLLVSAILALHPLWEAGAAGYPALYAAAIWADRAALLGVIYMLFGAPFVLDRVRRIQVEAVEMSKPFMKRPYTLGKLGGSLLPVLLILLLSGPLHLALTIFTATDVQIWPLLAVYGRGFILLVVPSVVFMGALAFAISLFVRPIIIPPLGLLYLVQTSLTQRAADAQFSWISPIVRPEYFDNYTFPAALETAVISHQLLYLMLGIVCAAAAVAAFQRQWLLGEKAAPTAWPPRWPHKPVLTFTPPSLRRFWGTPVIAALVLALLSPAIALDTYTTETWIKENSAFLVLEFYFALVGLFLFTGVITRDKGLHVLDLVLTKPVNRWKLLMQRLVPAVGIYLAAAFLLVIAIHLAFTPLPLAKAFFVASTTGFYLGMVGMTVANATHNALAGYGAGVVYWFFEAGVNGRFTAPFYLLMASHQPNLNDFWRFTHSLWLPNKVGLLLLACWLLFLNGWLLDTGPKRWRAFIILAVTIPLIFALGWWAFPLLWGGK